MGLKFLKRLPHKFKNEQHLNKFKTELKHSLIDKMFNSFVLFHLFIVNLFWVYNRLTINDRPNSLFIKNICKNLN